MYIQSTFIHLDKLGEHKERELWNKKILSWGDYQENIEKTNLFFESKDSKLYSSFKALDQKDIEYFANKIKKTEYYRLAISFPEDVLFLDIERPKDGETPTPSCESKESPKPILGAMPEVFFSLEPFSS